MVLKDGLSEDTKTGVKEALSHSFTALQRRVRKNNVYEGSDVLRILRDALVEGAEMVILDVGSDFLPDGVAARRQGGGRRRGSDRGAGGGDGGGGGGETLLI